MSTQRSPLGFKEEIHLTLVDDLVAAQAELRERLREVEGITDEERDVPMQVSPPDGVVRDLTVTQELNSIPLPPRWNADAPDNPFSPPIPETALHPETKGLGKRSGFKTGAGEGAQQRQESPIPTEPENQLAATDFEH